MEWRLKAVLTVEQVLDELDNDEELSEGSEDEFDGYLEECGLNNSTTFS